MSKRQILMILGVWVLVFLFLGFPSAWDRALGVATGLLIVALSYSLGPKIKDPEAAPYVEHKNEHKTEVEGNL